MPETELIRIIRPRGSERTLRAQAVFEGPSGEPESLHVVDIEAGEAVELRLRAGEAIVIGWAQ